MRLDLNPKLKPLAVSQGTREELESLARSRSLPAGLVCCARIVLLCKLLWQDIERRPDGVAVRKGVSQDRIVSVSDPEMRHGRKSRHRRFDGHKAEAGSQLITAVAVLPGNAPDNQGALDLVSETVADATYGDGETRQQFANAERTLIAKAPTPPRSEYFTKQDFPSTWRPAAVPVRRERSRPASTVRGATATDTGSAFRAGPSSSRLRSVTAVPCDHSV